MTDAFSLTSITHDLYQFISSLQRPLPGDNAWASAAREHCAELAARVATARKTLTETQENLARALEQLRTNLQEFASDLETGPSMARLREGCLSLARSYEELVVQVKKARAIDSSGAERRARPRHVKPINYSRNIFHVLNGLFGALLYEFFLTRDQALGILLVMLAMAATLEISRRYSTRLNDFLMDHLFRLVTRPRERHHVNSATYYLIGLTMITALLPKEAVVVAVLILGLGDPAASICGRRWGRRRLYKEKSLAGTLTFFLVAFATSLSYFGTRLDGFGWPAYAGMAAGVAIAGALAELFSDRLDDNFTIPVLCALIATLWLLP